MQFKPPNSILAAAPLRTVGKRIRWVGLGGLGNCILSAHLLNQYEQLPGLSCPILHFTGIPCLTCGMTRSFTAIARGDLTTATAFHWLGPLVFFGFILAIIHILLELCSGRHLSTFYTRMLRKPIGLITLLIVAIAYHSYRLYLLNLEGTLLSDFLQSPLGQFLVSI